eukprot:14036678-Alexandrium_andersonii.AAC.1
MEPPRSGGPLPGPPPETRPRRSPGCATAWAADEVNLVEQLQGPSASARRSPSHGQGSRPVGGRVLDDVDHDNARGQP